MRRKIIGGETWILYDSYVRKLDAKRAASFLRNVKMVKARVIKQKETKKTSAMYRVYKRGK